MLNTDIHNKKARYDRTITLLEIVRKGEDFNFKKIGLKYLNTMIDDLTTSIHELEVLKSQFISASIAKKDEGLK